MKYRETQVLSGLKQFWASIGCLVLLLGHAGSMLARANPKGLKPGATYRYVLVPSDVADVLFDASNGTCKDCPAVKDIACQIARGSRACPWSCMMDVLDAAMVRVDDASCAVLKAYRNELERQAAAGDVMTVPVTAKRSFVCSPRTGCSGVLPPSFGNDLDILNTIRLNVCTAPCASGVFNVDCFDPSCLQAFGSCFLVSNACFSGCLGLRDSLSGVCANLDQVDQVNCTGTPFSGLPVNILCDVCPPAQNPQLPAPPVLPNVPGGSKTLICDLRVSTIEADIGLFGELGVEEDLNVLGSGVFGGDLDVGGNVRIGGSLDVGSGVVGGGALQIAGDGLFNGSVCISGDTRINDDLCAGGLQVVADTVVGGSLLVNQDVTAGGRICALSGLCSSGPICANDIIARRIKSDYACIDDASIDRVTSELGCVDLLCVGQLGAEQACLSSLVSFTACVGTLDASQLRSMSACIGNLRAVDVVGVDACLDNARVNTLNAQTACLGNVYADRVGAATAIIDNLDVCTELVAELFVSDLAKYNGSLSGLCWPQGFGELHFTAKDFCLPLCPDGPDLGADGCMYMPGAYAYWPYDFDLGCDPQALICGAPIPLCDPDQSKPIGFAPHVDFVVPADYDPNGTFEVDVYVVFTPNNPGGGYELGVGIGSVSIAAPCDLVPLPSLGGAVPAQCAGMNSIAPGMGIAKFSARGPAGSLVPGAWTRMELLFTDAPPGFDTPCPPQISSMVFRYPRVDINEAAAIFPG